MKAGLALSDERIVIFKIGDAVIAPELSVQGCIPFLIDAPARIMPLELARVGYVASWTPPALPWRWRNRFVRWLLIHLLRRHPPDAASKFVYAVTINDQEVARRFGYATADANKELFSAGPMAVLPSDRVQVLVQNYGNRPIRFAAFIGGWRLQ